MTRLLRLYPRRWRDQYEDEVRALLEEYPLSTKDRLDLIRSAAHAWVQVSRRREPRPRVRVPARSGRKGRRHRTAGSRHLAGVAAVLLAALSLVAAWALPPFAGTRQALATGTLPALALQIGDLGSGYRQIYSRYEKHPRLRRTDGSILSEKQLRRHGHLRTFTAAFDLPQPGDGDISHPRALWVETISKYQTFESAYWAYHIGLYGGGPIGELGQHSRLWLPPRVDRWSTETVRFMRYNYVVTISYSTAPLRVLPILRRARTVDGRVKNLVERTAK